MKIVMALMAAFALLTGGMGIAYAAEDPEPTAARTCEVVDRDILDVNAQLDEALADAKLPVTLDGVTYQNLGAVNTALAALPNIDAVSGLRNQLKAIVDANALVKNLNVDLDALKNERTTCVTETPIENPVETDPPFESCQEALDAGVTLPILKGNENYSENLDSDGDGVACELGDGDGTGGNTDEPTPADPATDNNDSDNDVINPTQFDDIPNTSRGVDTGGL